MLNFLNKILTGGSTKPIYSTRLVEAVDLTWLGKIYLLSQLLRGIL